MSRTERGSITALIIALAAIVLLLVVVVVDASAGYLRSEGLNAVADAAALAATDGIQGEDAYTRGLEEKLTIEVSSAGRFVEEYLVSSGAVLRYPTWPGGWTCRCRCRGWTRGPRSRVARRPR